MFSSFEILFAAVGRQFAHRSKDDFCNDYNAAIAAAIVARTPEQQQKSDREIRIARLALKLAAGERALKYDGGEDINIKRKDIERRREEKWLKDAANERYREVFEDYPIILSEACRRVLGQRTIPAYIAYGD